MFFLRREYIDGPTPPEIVLLHSEVTTGGRAPGFPLRCTRVAVPVGDSGRRVAHIPLPEPAPGGQLLVRYRFTVVSAGEESCSPYYEVPVPSDDLIADLFHLPESGGGNLPPAPGRGYFRTVLPLEEGEIGSGRIRYGFGAMRKKPSPSLCRVSIDTGGGPAPVLEIPEALAVLKGRPMPYFLHHAAEDGTLRSHKIACARIAWKDPAGEVVSARLVWGDTAWRATNLSLMEVKGGVAGPAQALGEFFDPDHGAFLSARAAALSPLPLPRVFEAFVFGPSGSGVEYCFLVVVRRKDGTFSAQWRNREGGGNWRIVL